MLVKYVITAGSSMSLVTTDVAKLITGTPVSELSSACDKAVTEVISATASGWTMTDLPNLVIGAPCAAGLSTKYLKFVGNTTALNITGYEEWPVTTKVPTTQKAIAPSTATGMTYLWVYATPRSVFIFTETVGVCAVEFSRDAGYLRGTDYPCFAVGTFTDLQSHNACSVPRVKNQSAAGNTAPAAPYIATLAQRNATFRHGPEGPMRDANEVYRAAMRPIWFVFSNQGIIGQVLELLEVSKNTNTRVGETFTQDGNTYMIIAVGGNPVIVYGIKVV